VNPQTSECSLIPVNKIIALARNKAAMLLFNIDTGKTIRSLNYNIYETAEILYKYPKKP
jgi:hypothetical protein